MHRVGYIETSGAQRHLQSFPVYRKVFSNDPFSTISYRVPIIYGSVNTTAEPVPFPDWLGFPTFARLSTACHHDRQERDTVQSADS